MKDEIWKKSLKSNLELQDVRYLREKEKNLSFVNSDFSLFSLSLFLYFITYSFTSL